MAYQYGCRPNRDPTRWGGAGAPSQAGLLNSTNSYVQKAQQAEIDYALGNMTNTHELGVYQQEANIALQYTVAIRDKALEAYNSIMNMSM